MSDVAAGAAVSPGWAGRAVLAAIRFYRLFFSAWVGSGCRFEPTCSLYAQQAVLRHGAVAGSYLAARRIVRCHPGCRGGIDHVPAQAPRFFS